MSNPFFKDFTAKYGAIPFDQIRLEHFLPAIEKALETARRKVKLIKENPEAPNFNNTMLALQEADEDLIAPTSVYYHLESAESDNEFKALSDVISPMIAEYQTEVSTDEMIFQRVKVVYDNRSKLGLTPEQLRLVEVSYKGFVRNGALLEGEQKEEFKNIEQELSKLSPQFSKNFLNATNAFSYHTTDEADIAGLPKTALEAATMRAKQKGFKQGWLFNLQFPSSNAVQTYCNNRELRKKIYLASNSRSFNDEFDNQENILKMVNLRDRKAKLLGYKNYAHYILEERMAETTETVFSFLNRIYEIAMPVAKKEVEEIRQYAKRLDGIDELMPWDLSYYGEKLKLEKFGFDTEQLRPYFKAENCVQGLFRVAEKLYGLRFVENTELPKWHKDVKVYEVFEGENSFVGLLYIDLYPRETKNGGAWMDCLKSQGLFRGKVERPHVIIVGNLTPSTEATPSLLSLEDVETLFHEFGHALHGLLSNCTYAGLASPRVEWDFVELPSQIMENWVLEEEALSLFAFHYQTGEVMPKELIEKVKSAQNYMKGWSNIRQLTFGMLDMDWYTADPATITDVKAFEANSIEKLRILPKIDSTCLSTILTHIFSGGYSAGYYSYKWAEVLDADAFGKFKETGVFNPQTAKSFRENVLARGNTEPPMDLFTKFRGRKPDPDAMLIRDGLLKK